MEPSSTVGAWGLLILRVGVGLMVFYIHGWHKFLDGLAYLNTGKAWRLAAEVAEMGFPLPVPSAFAATAVQFVCSLRLIAGLFTRLNAVLLAGTLGVAILQNLLAHRDPQLAVLYTLIMVSIGFLGGGHSQNTPSQNPAWHGLFPLLLLAPSTVFGADTGASVPPAYKQLRYDEDYHYLQDSSRHGDFLDTVKFIPLNQAGDSYLSLGGEIRQRYEYFHNWNWGDGPQDDNGYLLQRYMIHGDTHFTEHFRIFTQFKSNLESGRNGGPRPTDEDQFDLNQLFADGKLTWDEKDSFTLRLGRQEMAFGSSRLVSVRESPNVRRSFDGARGILNLGEWRVDAFAAKPVETNPGVFDDSSDPEQSFWGAYGVTPLPFLPGGHVDLYYLGLEREHAEFDQGAGRELRHSLGARLWGNKGALDYNFEVVYQFGTFGDGNIGAWTAASDTGYSFRDVPLKPRLALKADFASGDSNPKDPDLGTFNALFPKGAYFAQTSLIGPANIIDLHPYSELQLASSVSFTLDWDFFWRESTQDRIYGNAVNLVRSGGDSRAREIGNQVQALVEWEIQRHLTFSAAYAHFFAGKFLKDTQPGKDVDYVSTWATFKF